MQKGFLLIWILIAALMVAILSVGTYIVVKNQSNKQTPQPTTQPSPTFKFTDSNQKSPVNLRGKVIKNDRGCDVDDLCILTIQDETGSFDKIEYGGGFSWCIREPRGKVVDDVKVGDMVEVYAATTLAGNNYLTICGNKEFFIRKSAEGAFCGGIANIECPEGYKCQLDGSYPDAGGKCIMVLQ